MPSFVAFPWYDSPFLRSAHDRLWEELKGRLLKRGIRHLPLSRDTSCANDVLLRSEDLVLTQTCGYDLATNTPRFLNIVGTPVFDLPQCPAGYYFSFIVAKKLKPSGKMRLAINDERSWSGCHTLLQFCETENIEIDPTKISFTKSHFGSLEKLLHGESDLAAIDVMTWSLYTKNRPELSNDLLIIGQSDFLPAPPYVTCSATSPQTTTILFDELDHLFRERPWIRKTLYLKSLQKFTHEQYLAYHRASFSEGVRNTLLKEKLSWSSSRRVHLSENIISI